MQTLHAPLAASSVPQLAPACGAARLQAHIAKIGITQTAFAERIGVSKGYVTELLNGSKRPSLPLATRIETETGAAVPATSWVVRSPSEVQLGQSK